METAYVMINCEMGAEGTIVEGVKSLDSVKEVSGVFGNYDIIVKLECLDVEEMRETIATKIRLMSKVRCTTTLMCSN
ncbi:MAG: Lrp/AsnC ligand binding domain-containing protein [Nitrosotalea sp.]